MPEMRRLIFVHGPWQLLMVASALKQAAHSPQSSSWDTLVIFSLHDGPLPAQIREVMSRIAPAIWPWRRVAMLTEMTDWNARDARGSIAALRAKLDEDEPDELWLDNVNSPTEKIAAEAYPAARIVLYEDGLHTYLFHEDHYLSAVRCVREPRMAYRALKLRIRERLDSNDLSISAMLPRHLARVVASYLWISLMVPPADYQRRLPWIQLHTRFVKDVLTELTPIVDDIDLEVGSGQRAILLGQCFSNYGMPRDFELDCYIDMARQLQKMGFEVIWKEHPRTRQPFLSELVQAVGVRGVPDLGPWPIELFVERMGLTACASLTSTSLFSIPLLFNLPSFSTADRYISMLNFPDDSLARLVAEVIPQFKDDESLSQARSLTDARVQSSANLAKSNSEPGLVVDVVP